MYASLTPDRIAVFKLQAGSEALPAHGSQVISGTEPCVATMSRSLRLKVLFQPPQSAYQAIIGSRFPAACSSLFATVRSLGNSGRYTPSPMVPDWDSVAVAVAVAVAVPVAVAGA